MNRYLNKTWRRTLRKATKLVPPRKVAELTRALQKGWAQGMANAMEAAASAAAQPGVGTPSADSSSANVANAGAADPSGRVEMGSFTNAAGTRHYRLFVPVARPGRQSKRPLLVMLHGCGQDPQDFAVGTRADEIAIEHDALVLYPAQAQSANMQRCWNWYQPADQHRGQGEPSIIAEMTRQVMLAHDIDPRRVYVAGLSAGGAMATTMATNYPDLYAALGVHSGLPHGAAHDVMSALAAMRQGPPRATSDNPIRVPTIVFHGDDDSTVHPCNGAEIVARFQAMKREKQLDWVAEDTRTPRVVSGQVPGGQAYTRTDYPGPTGEVIVEHWLVHGAGHAWSGGNPSGSYTDRKGPDATREMFRFFLAHPQHEPH